jgi:hypothetical protein
MQWSQFSQTSKQEEVITVISGEIEQWLAQEKQNLGDTVAC